MWEELCSGTEPTSSSLFKGDGTHEGAENEVSKLPASGEATRPRQFKGSWLKSKRVELLTQIQELLNQMEDDGPIRPKPKGFALRFFTVLAKQSQEVL
jgi:hypothetical protein